MTLDKDLIKQFLIEAAKVGVRAAAISFGTVLVKKGLVTDAQWTTFMSGAAIVIATLIFSLLEKYKVIKYISDLLAQGNSDTTDK